MDTRLKTSVEEQFKRVDDRFRKMEDKFSFLLEEFESNKTETRLRFEKIEKSQEQFMLMQQDIHKWLRPEGQERGILGASPARVDLTEKEGHAEANMTQWYPRKGVEASSWVLTADGSQPQFQERTSETNRVHIPLFLGCSPLLWIRSCEKYFLENQVPEDKKISVAAFYLEERARSWFMSWNLEHEAASWSDFAESLCSQFSNKIIRNIIDEFNHLEQNDTVREYVRKFEESKAKMLRVCSHFTERYFISSFVGGLNDAIKPLVKAHSPETLEDVIDKAKFYELTLEMLYKTNDAGDASLGDVAKFCGVDDETGKELDSETEVVFESESNRGLGSECSMKFDVVDHGTGYNHFCDVVGALGLYAVGQAWRKKIMGDLFDGYAVKLGRISLCDVCRDHYYFDIKSKPPDNSGNKVKQSSSSGVDVVKIAGSGNGNSVDLKGARNGNCVSFVGDGVLVGITLLVYNSGKLVKRFVKVGLVLSATNLNFLIVQKLFGDLRSYIVRGTSLLSEFSKYNAMYFRSKEQLMVILMQVVELGSCGASKMDILLQIVATVIMSTAILEISVSGQQLLVSSAVLKLIVSSLPKNEETTVNWQHLLTATTCLKLVVDIPILVGGVNIPIKGCLCTECSMIKCYKLGESVHVFLCDHLVKMIVIASYWFRCLDIVKWYITWFGEAAEGNLEFIAIKEQALLFKQLMGAALSKIFLRDYGADWDRSLGGRRKITVAVRKMFRTDSSSTFVAAFQSPMNVQILAYFPFVFFLQQWTTKLFVTVVSFGGSSLLVQQYGRLFMPFTYEEVQIRLMHDMAKVLKHDRCNTISFARLKLFVKKLYKAARIIIDGLLLQHRIVTYNHTCDFISVLKLKTSSVVQLATSQRRKQARTHTLCSVLDAEMTSQEEAAVWRARCYDFDVP